MHSGNTSVRSCGCTKSPQRPSNPAQAEKPLKVSHSDVKSKEKAEKEMKCLSPCFPFRKKGGRKKRKRKKIKEKR